MWTTIDRKRKFIKVIVVTWDDLVVLISKLVFRNIQFQWNKMCSWKRWWVTHSQLTSLLIIHGIEQIGYNAVVVSGIIGFISASFCSLFVCTTSSTCELTQTHYFRKQWCILSLMLSEFEDDKHVFFVVSV